MVLALMHRETIAGLDYMLVRCYASVHHEDRKTKHFKKTAKTKDETVPEKHV